MRTEQELRDDGERTEVRFPLRIPANVSPSAIQVLVSRVSVGGRADPGLMNAFKPAVQTTPDGGPAVVLSVDLNLAAAPVTYEVDLALTHDDSLDAFEHITVTLTHPSAKLRPLSLLVVARSWPLFLNRGYPSHVVLTETSNRSRLTRMAIQHPDAPTRDGQPIEAHLTLAPPDVIAPGASAELPLSFEGPFPVGTTRGRVELSAPQLDSPMKIDYEVRLRVTSFAIPIVFLFGAGIGNLTRDRLKKREERLVRLVRARDLRRRLERLAARSSATERAALHVAINALREEVDEALEQAIGRGEELLAKTLTDRAARQRDIVERAGKELALLGQGWILPPALDLTQLREAYEDAQRRAADDDLAAAEEALSVAPTKGRELARAARTWAVDVEQGLASLANARPPGKEPFESALPDLRAGLEAIRDVDVEAGIEPLLRAVHAVNDAALDGTRALSHALARAAADAAAVACSAVDAEAIVRATALPADMFSALDAKVALEPLAAGARALEREVRALIERILIAPEERGEVSALLEACRFDEAIRSANKLAEERAKRATPARAGPIAFGEDDASEAGEASASPRELGRAPRVRRGVPSMQEPRSIVLLAARAAENADADVDKQLRNTRSARTVISAGILAVLTWAFYEHDFFGTGRELVSLFVLGFTTDLSADALFSALERAKKA